MPRAIEFKDSLEQPAGTSQAAATRILQNLNLAEECPAPSNRAFQADGWSCGLWVIRWIERKLREINGEPRHKPMSLKELGIRSKFFIEKIRSASTKPVAEAAPKPVAKAKAYKNVEPVFESLDLALQAGLACTKCIVTKQGTKGCRACMGELFEEIRMKRARGSL